MLTVRIICVGKLKENFYLQAAAEYAKRLGAYCRLEIEEVPEARRTGEGEGAIQAALEKEAAAIREKIPKGAAVCALCIEGKTMSSPEFSRCLERLGSMGGSRVCFIIGGSDGMDESIKKQADARLSMSPMTFPHHLARVMVLEQIYRAFQISTGGKYHK